LVAIAKNDIYPSAGAPESINVALRQHQETLCEWEPSQQAAELYHWAERMIFAFKLEIPLPCLAVDRLKRALGHFRGERNGFGLRDEIAIDSLHLKEDPTWQVLVTLLHKLLHARQQRHGRPGKRNYHNIQYRGQARSLGLVVDELGVTSCTPGRTAFRQLLAVYGISVPECTETESPVSISPHSPLVPAKPKLKLWECRCGVKVRVGRSSFHAQCLDCNGLFELKS
jgi:hypothetical protein